MKIIKLKRLMSTPRPADPFKTFCFQDKLWLLKQNVSVNYTNNMCMTLDEICQADWRGSLFCHLQSFPLSLPLMYTLPTTDKKLVIVGQN